MYDTLIGDAIFFFIILFVIVGVVVVKLRNNGILSSRSDT